MNLQINDTFSLVPKKVHVWAYTAASHRGHCFWMCIGPHSSYKSICKKVSHQAVNATTI